ncbi:hypothetical protein RSAG8_10846, partial [Rhizoctonia solani AG-8 WAC10335]
MQQDDGWLVDSSAAPESPSFRNNLLPSNHYSFMQSPTGNALGLALPTDPPVIPVARRPPSPVGSASITYYSGTPHASGYVHALMSEGLSVDLCFFKPFVRKLPCPAESPRCVVTALPKISSSSRPTNRRTIDTTPTYRQL